MKQLIRQSAKSYEEFEKEIQKIVGIDDKRALKKIREELGKRLIIIAESNRINTYRVPKKRIFKQLKDRILLGYLTSSDIWDFFHNSEFAAGRTTKTIDRSNTNLIKDGLKSYRKLEKVPLPDSHKVVAIEDLFTDKQCLAIHKNAKTVILNTFHFGNSKKEVYPSINKYALGQYVTFNFDPRNKYKKAWYKDPFDGMKVKHDWKKEFNFNGTPINN